jgi:hypothetical protein
MPHFWHTFETDFITLRKFKTQERLVTYCLFLSKWGLQTWNEFYDRNLSTLYIYPKVGEVEVSNSYFTKQTCQFQHVEFSSSTIHHGLY